MKRVVFAVARGLGLFAAARRLTRRRLRILAYHGIWEGPGHFGNFLFMKPETFADRMALLRKLAYPVLPLGDALEKLDAGTLPANAVVITIDDGWVGTCRHMGRELQRHGFPATLYVSTYYSVKQAPVFDVTLRYLLAVADCDTLAIRGIGGETLFDGSLGTPQERESAQLALAAYAQTLSSDDQRQALLAELASRLNVDFESLLSGRWLNIGTPEELSRLVEQGVDLQLHTHRHCTRWRGADCLAAEIEDNRAALAPLTPAPLVHFCYPSGQYTPGDWAPLEALGVRSATTTDIGLVSPGSPRYALPRILDGESLSALELEAELSGFLHCTRAVRARLATMRMNSDDRVA